MPVDHKVIGEIPQHERRQYASEEDSDSSLCHIKIISDMVSTRRVVARQIGPR